ncbi:hypothetical protein [Deinococcus altitudinis]|uniref:hypothetical protein n=1 Tax=Deinococcus altitudinis TaxID=468914 RepID=UPI0038915723
MSDEKVSKFGVLKGLQQSSKTVNSQTQPVPEELPLQEVRFTNYLDAEVSRRLQIHVAQLKSRKVPGGERVSIKSVLHQALVEYLERHDG